MTITIYYTSSEKNAFPKDLMLVGTYTGDLLEETSILDPVVEFESATIPNANYCYIREFGRRYFINDMVSVSRDLIRVYMHVDVLDSFCNRIRNCRGYIDRQENNFNGNLPDPSVVVEGPKVRTVHLGVNTDFKWTGSETGYLNSANPTVGNNYVAVIDGSGKDPSDNYIEKCSGFTHCAMPYGEYQALLLYLKTAVDPLHSKLPTDYLFSLMWFPISLNTTGTTIKDVEIQHGADWSIPAYGSIRPGVVRYQYESALFKVTIPVYNDEDEYFRNYEPYTELWMEFQPFGRIRLDNTICFPSGITTTTTDIYFKVTVNTITGDAVLHYGRSGDVSTYLASAQVAINLPFSSSNYNLLRMAQGIVPAIATISAGVVSENPALVIGGAAQAVGSFVGNEMRQPLKGLDGKLVDSVPSVHRFASVITSFAPDVKGRSAAYVSDTLHITGYTRYSEFHAEDIYTTSHPGYKFYALNSELSEIENLMKSGVYLNPLA